MSFSRRDEILEEAFELPAEQLCNYLDQQCGGDLSLRAEVERMLGQSKRMQDFLDQPASEWTLSPLKPGQKVGRYLIESIIGSGGMSVVYQAKDVGIGRKVAIKILTSSYASAAEEAPYTAEVRMLGSIRHPNVVQIFDFGQVHGVPYIVMEYLQGKDLACTIAARECGDLQWKLSVAYQLASALHHVHCASIIHRDVKPANVFVGPNGTVTLMDFGISRFDNPGTTKTQTLVGTPEYLPPEHVKGERLTNRSDVYSYGILLFELFAEQKAFSGNTAEVLYRIVHDETPIHNLRDRNLPKRLIALVRAATRKNPAERPSDFGEIIETLAEIRRDRDRRPVLPDRIGVKVATAVICCAGGLGLVSYRLFSVPSKELRSLPSGTVKPTRLQRVPPQPTQEASSLANSNEKGSGMAPVPKISPRKPVIDQVGTNTRGPMVQSSETVRMEQQESSDRRKSSAPPTSTEIQDTPLELPLPEVRQPNMNLVARVPHGSEGTPATTKFSENPNGTSKILEVQTIRATAQREVLATLNDYSEAYAAKDIGRMAAVFPSMSGVDHQKLVLAFSVARDVELKLVPEDDPQIEIRSDGSAVAATVRCRRSIKMTPFSGRAPKPFNDVCIFRLQLSADGWRIASQKTN
jgi:serine/threonine protein kinase